MRGDFSRQTFDPARHHAAVLQQQGRVQLDADWNEQQLLALHRHATTTRDVVGTAGAPRGEPGFRITPTGPNLLISRGRFHLEGILCELEADTLITAQRDLPGFSLPAADGVYLAYLEAWLRHESAAENPSLRETALGGADTATRLRTLSQVRLLALPTTGAAATCGGNAPEWTALLAQRSPSASTAGRLSARTAPAGVTSDPACVLPPSAGFKGLENQLYRVEIHQGGNRNSARFKWSRENGSVVTPITAINGLVLTVESTGRDDKLAFAPNQWVEVSDDALDLGEQRGRLFRIATVDPANRLITLTGGVLPALDPTRHRVLRRWDQSAADATADGQPLNSADWITLEDGIQVHFEPGTYKVGDFWLIPARSSVSIETGRIDWPVDTASDPIAVATQGNHHHLVRLAILQRTGGNWSALAGQADCRIVFPPLTGITASDVAFDNNVCSFSPAAVTVQQALDELCRERECMCTLLIRPGDDVGAAFAQLGPNHDALVCFQAGDYRIEETVIVSGKGHLRITGCGPATRLFSAQAECALRFENCPSVSVESLRIDGGPPRAASLNGALTFTDCPGVAVRQCVVTTRGAGSLQTAAITVRNAANLNAPSVVRITGCDLSVGHLQTGILLVNASRSFIEDNVIRAEARPPTLTLLENRDYRARVRRNLLSNVIFGSLPGGNAGVTNATVGFNGQIIHFRTLSSLTTTARDVNAWASALVGTSPSEAPTPLALFRLLERKADRAMLGIPTANLPATIRTAAASVLSQDPPSGLQGIVVAGTRADEVRILNNHVEDFLQGIHIGLSHSTSNPGAPDVAGDMILSGNHIRIRLGATATLERHGIFVGNFTSLQIRSNFIEARRESIAGSTRTEGIRVYGTAGPRLTIRDNHLDRFEVGIAFVTRVLPVPRLWVVTENLAVNAGEVVQAFRRTGSSLVAIRAQIRGIDQNAP
jgi:hypothetical protein